MLHKKVVLFSLLSFALIQGVSAMHKEDTTQGNAPRYRLRPRSIKPQQSVRIPRKGHKRRLFLPSTEPTSQATHISPASPDRRATNESPVTSTLASTDFMWTSPARLLHLTPSRQISTVETPLKEKVRNAVSAAGTPNGSAAKPGVLLSSEGRNYARFLNFSDLESAEITPSSPVLSASATEQNFDVTPFFNETPSPTHISNSSSSEDLSEEELGEDEEGSWDSLYMGVYADGTVYDRRYTPGPASCNPSPEDHTWSPTSHFSEDDDSTYSEDETSSLTGDEGDVVEPPRKRSKQEV